MHIVGYDLHRELISTRSNWRNYSSDTRPRPFTTKIRVFFHHKDRYFYHKDTCFFTKDTCLCGKKQLRSRVKHFRKNCKHLRAFFLQSKQITDIFCCSVKQNQAIYFRTESGRVTGHKWPVYESLMTELRIKSGRVLKR